MLNNAMITTCLLLQWVGFTVSHLILELNFIFSSLMHQLAVSTMLVFKA
jgi:hypothetical protein